jgi:uncharacterized membrane protein
MRPASLTAYGVNVEMASLAVTVRDHCERGQTLLARGAVRKKAMLASTMRSEGIDVTEPQTVLDAATATDADDDVAVAAQVVGEQGVIAEGAVAAEGPHALIVARFADPTLAMSTYDDLIDAEVAGLLQVDGVLVIKAGADGKLHVQKMTDHSTRTGLKWGIVGGVVAAVFLPATIVAGAVALGVAGAAAGKARNLYHRAEVEKELAGVITPGTSGILALVSAIDADAVARKMPEAEQVKTVPVDEETAGAIKAAAATAASQVALATPA